MLEGRRPFFVLPRPTAAQYAQLCSHPSQSRSRGRRTAAQRLKYLMEQSETTPTQLAKILNCSQPLVSLILSGKRDLSKANAKKLARRFRLDVGYFL